jgi:hypothetical protein
MGVRDILVGQGKKLAASPFWPGAAMLFRNLAGNAIHQAMTISLQLAPVSRP